MKQLRWTVPVLLIVTVNAFVLGGVAWNRAEPPEATLTLTERELPLAYGWSANAENSGVALHLRRCCGDRDFLWFDEEKLEALGFNPKAYRDQEDELRKPPLARRAYAVLEFDGPAWDAAVRKKEQEMEELRAKVEAGEANENQLPSAREALQRMRVANSRLVAVDAGIDAEVLRRRYPDTSRYLITPARFRMNRCYGSRCDGFVTGRLVRVLTSPIHVPARFHENLMQAIDSGSRYSGYYSRRDPPRYRVKLHYGRRYEPWVAAIEPLEPAGGPGKGNP